MALLDGQSAPSVAVTSVAAPAEVRGGGCRSPRRARWEWTAGGAAAAVQPALGRPSLGSEARGELEESAMFRVRSTVAVLGLSAVLAVCGAQRPPVVE